MTDDPEAWSDPRVEAAYQRRTDGGADTYEIDSQRVHTMVHQLTLVLERNAVRTPVEREHVENARDWLLAVTEDQA